jgi:hypothetical protein
MAPASDPTGAPLDAPSDALAPEATTAQAPASAPAKRKPRAKRAAPAAAQALLAAVEAPTPAPDALECVAEAPATPEAGRPARHKQKLVRDSFTMPRADFELIDVLKKRMLEQQRHTKKSELLRAGLQVLNTLSPSQLATVLDDLPLLKPGRPRKSD